MARVLSLLLLLTPVVPVTAWAGTILVVGDSLSAAYGLPVEEGWVDLLQERLDARYGDWNLINASISGDTTAGARARLPQAMQRHHPDILILELGGNDGLRGLPLPEMKANLSAMIGVAREHRSRVLLVCSFRRTMDAVTPNALSKSTGSWRTSRTSSCCPRWWRTSERAQR
jgi:acyl-CoA thioesterase-1